MKYSDQCYRSLPVILAIGILLICSSCQSTPASTDLNGSVLFARQDDLWLVDLDGRSDPQQLTADGLLNWSSKDRFFMASDYRRVFLSPDGRWAAFSRTGLELMVLNLEDRSLIQIPGPGNATADWSPDARSLAFVAEKRLTDGYDDLYVYDIETDRLRQVLHLERGSQGAIRKSSVIWSPDGRSIGFVCNQDLYFGQLCRYDLTSETLQVVSPLQHLGFYTVWLCWSADGELTIDPKQGGRCVRSGEQGQYDWAFSPDGRYMLELERVLTDNAFRPDDPVRIRLHHLGDGQTVWEKELDLPLRRAVWTPDGAALFLDDAEESTPIWKMPADGSSAPEVWLEDGYLIGVTTAELEADNLAQTPTLPHVAAEAALPHAMKGYELYSWQTNGDWHFTLMTGTNRSKSLDEITADENIVTHDGWVKITVQGVEALETILGQLPAGESVFWSGGPGSGPAPSEGSILTLPPQGTVAAIQESCGLLDLKLQVSK